MKFGLLTLLLAFAILAHMCAKPSWTKNLCADGSTVVTTLIPFAIQTEYDDGELKHQRFYVGACGHYVRAWSTALPIQYWGTRYCFVQKLNAIDGANLVVTIRGDARPFVHLSGFVQSVADFESAIEVLDEHDWAGPCQAYVDIRIGNEETRKMFWHKLPESSSGT